MEIIRLTSVFSVQQHIPNLVSEHMDLRENHELDDLKAGPNNTPDLISLVSS